MKCRLCGRDINQLQNKKRKRCNSCNTKIRRYRTKLAAVKFLGGKCIVCGYDKNIRALEFHHKIPGHKDMNLSKMANKSWDVVKEELIKCELVCSNCHRERHTEEIEEKIYKEIKNYSGRLLEF